MTQAMPMIQLGGRLPWPPPSRRVRPSLSYSSVGKGVSGLSTGMAAPPPSGDWASRQRHQYGWPVPYAPPARPETIARRSPWLYGEPFGFTRGLGLTVDQGITATGGMIASIAPLTGPAAPFVAIGGAVVALLGSIGIGQGCGQTCIDATTFANQSAALMQQNMAAYFAIPAPRPISLQQQALQNFDQLWAALISPQACGNPQLGSAGQRCISERAPGGIYDDAKFNRTPIAQDPAVPDCQSSIAAQLPQCGAPSGSVAPGGHLVEGQPGSTQSTGVTGFDSKTMFLLLGLGVLAYAMSSQGGN